MTLPIVALADIERRVPARLRSTLQGVLRWLLDRPLEASAIVGSIARNEADEFSDIDLVVASSRPPDLVHTDFKDASGALGRIAVWFTAEHVGKPTSAIYYLEVEGWIVKIDLEVVPLDAAVVIEPDAIIVCDALARFRRGAAATAPRIDVDALEDRLCGWFWYSYGKIARGELFQAARSIDFSRENALVPLILMLNGLPQTGQRRIERRLPPEQLGQLKETYPTSLEPSEVHRALLALLTLYFDLRPLLTPLRTRPVAPDITLLSQLIRVSPTNI